MPETVSWVEAKFPQLSSNYRLPRSFYTQMLLRCSLGKTLWYSIRFRGIVLVGRGSRLRVHRSAQISLAPGSMLVIGMLHDTLVGASLRMYPRSRLYVAGRVQVMRACTVIVGYDATLRIGAGTFLNDGSSILCYLETTIGPGCAVASGVQILDTDVHRLLQQGSQVSPHSPVRIGRDCWVGTRALVLKGTHLGDGSVVAAGAVVSAEFPPRSLVVGVPGRVMRENVTWSL